MVRSSEGGITRGTPPASYIDLKYPGNSDTFPSLILAVMPIIGRLMAICYANSHNQPVYRMYYTFSYVNLYYNSDKYTEKSDLFRIFV